MHHEGYTVILPHPDVREFHVGFRTAQVAREFAEKTGEEYWIIRAYSDLGTGQRIRLANNRIRIIS